MTLREKLPQFVVAVPEYNWATMPLGGFPHLGIAPFSPHYAQPVKVKLRIPGTPYLISRGKDHVLTNKIIHHFGVVFSTGVEGPLPNDLVFELQLETNHLHTPITFQAFCGGQAPWYYPVQIDSNDKVIERLEDFFKNPKRYGFIRYNCEAFAREMMTGVPESKQVKRVLEGVKTFLEVTARIMVKSMEMAAAEIERKEKAEAAAAAQAQAASQARTTAMLAPPPPSVQQPAPAPLPAVEPPARKKARKASATKPKTGQKPRRKKG